MSLALEKVSYTYDAGSGRANTVLHDITLTIGEGSFIALIGHTGSGKSTLVQLLNGLLVPTKGRVLKDGKDIHAKDYDRRALRGRVGLVFQYPEHQLFEADVLTDVCFGPRALGLPDKECRERAREALLQCGMGEETWNVSPLALSGGQKRRCAIAGVLAMRPEVLVLDEPTAGLDPMGAGKMLKLIDGIRMEHRMTVILVSHNMEEVAGVAERLIVLNRGRIAYDAAPSTVFSHAKELEGMGLSVPGVTHVLHLLKARGLEIDTTAVTVTEAAEAILRA